MYVLLKGNKFKAKLSLVNQICSTSKGGTEIISIFANFEIYVIEF